MENTNQPYLFPEVQPSQPLVKAEPGDLLRRESEFAPSRVLLHLLLLTLTAITTTLTGAVSAVKVPVGVEPTGIIPALMAPFVALGHETARGNLFPLANGLLFTFTLLIILGAHELGHYFACRYYGIRATLPFFIPAPPVFTPFGTFGAVIKIKDRIRSRRALFDIGIAGPLAGFVFAIPASIIGLLIAKEEQPAAPGTGILQFHDPILFKIIINLFDLPQWIGWNPVFWAAWAALLVTTINLFPVGQLDGGHVLYAVAGRKTHRLVSILTCVTVAALAVASFVIYSSPIWFVWTLVLLFLLKVGHPDDTGDEPLGAGRAALAVVAAIVFLLCFMPFPITIS